MSPITDEIANLVQHAKDLAAKIGHELSQEGSDLLHRLVGQADELHQTVAADLGEDVTEIKGDAANLTAEVRTDASTPATAAPGGPVLTPSAPPHPATTIPSGVPVADITGSQITASNAPATSDAGSADQDPAATVTDDQATSTEGDVPAASQAEDGDQANPASTDPSATDATADASSTDATQTPNPASADPNTPAS